MFDPKWMRDHPDLLDRGLKRRGQEPASNRGCSRSTRSAAR